MKSVRVSVCCALMLGALSATAPARAQGTDDLLRSLQDEDADTRMSAFYALAQVGFASSDQLKRAAIALLVRETAIVRNHGPVQTGSREDYLAYVPNVAQVVASFDDPRAIDALAGMIDTGSMVTRALARQGQLSLDAITLNAGSAKAEFRRGAAATLFDMLELKTATDETSQHRIRLLLDSLAVDTDDSVAVWAIQSLALSSGHPLAASVTRVPIEVEPRGLSQRTAPRTATINLQSNSVIRIAFLSSTDLDATSIDTATLRINGGSAQVMGGAEIKDIDGDGTKDVITRFRTERSGLACGSTSLFLAGKTLSGEDIVGADKVTVTGCAAR